MNNDVFLPDDDFDEEPPRSNAWRIFAIIFGLAGLFFLVICGGGGWLVYSAFNKQLEKVQKQVAQQQAERFADMPAPVNETPAERSADIQSGYRAEEPNADPAILKGLNSYFQRMVDATRAGNETAFRALFDPKRQLEEIKTRGVMTRLTKVDETRLLNRLRSNEITMPSRWDRFHIVNYKQLKSGAEVVVYLHFWDGARWDNYRFWLIRSGMEWRGYDWEDLDYGFSQSMLTAILTEYEQLPLHTTYLRAFSLRSVAVDNHKQGNHELAVKMMNEAENSSVPPRLFDVHRLNNCYGWMQIYENQRALKAARSIEFPHQTAGALWVSAQIRTTYGMHLSAHQFAESYSQAVGGGPVSWQMLAEICDRLGRRDEAREYRKKLLELEPENVHLFVSIAQQADESHIPYLIEVARRNDDPAEFAAEVLRGMMHFGAPVVIQAFLDLMGELEPDAARTASLRSQFASTRQDASLAAEWAKKALDLADDEEKDEYVGRYLGALAAAGRIVEAYELSPDPAAIFRQFAVDFEFEDGPISLSPDKIKALVELHQSRFPDDPWLHYYLAQQCEKRQEIDVAERHYRTALNKVEDHDLTTILRSLVALLERNKRLLQSFDELPQPEAVFRQVVEKNMWDRSAGMPVELKEQYAAKHPDDPWLVLCAVLIERQAGNASEALRLALAGCGNENAEPIKLHLRRIATEITVESDGNLAAVYKVYGDPEQALPSLLSASENKQAAKRSAILEYHLVNHGMSPIWSARAIDFYWEKKEYDEVVKMIAPVRDRFLQDMNNGDRNRVSSIYAQSLARLGRIDDATKFAEMLFDEYGLSRPLIEILIETRNAERISEIFREFGADRWNADSFYSFGESKLALRSADFLSVRETAPPSLEIPHYLDSAVLLRDDTNVSTIDAVRAAAHSVWGESCTIEPLPEVTGTTKAPFQGRWLIRSGRLCWCVTVGEGPYFQPNQAFEALQKAENIAAFSRQRSWIRIQLVDSDRSRDSASLDKKECLRFASRLRDSQTVALYLATNSFIFVTDTADLGAVLESDDAEDKLNEVGEHCYFMRIGDTESDERAPNIRDEKFIESLRTAAVALKTLPTEPSFEFNVVLRGNDASEVLTFQPRRVMTNQYGFRTWLGRLTSNSRILPYLTVGEPVACTDDQIIEWKKLGGEAAEGEKRR